ncbi:MAG: MOSC domain-containing protein [Hoeflea sp.]|uniref:MOSC domain-containing protein n=1 Tax=Hoeflea sp. TaxID=1940281 RepID=UPI001D5D0421|nr:MOSC domain-containing protein [Hoeflea sp.]MBU4529154.1 MOSC domain-containing protein [Alphaproteobacteria bacterium]MBU4543559.1 MOSC domain-containing protein [Alphaproteobacteria bacterium]MBU4549184.1 MOSC domain-containing protein [Alphaproteobacteria bacterium]MBV1725319.1 MOSC domain-containing protein [Hoeflea sp.]MBV1785280.1 MOSC domain-containing protein [Hoeflea sp.]
MNHTPEISARVVGLYMGQVRHPWPGKPGSAIAKEPVEGPQDLGRDGFEMDSQADLKVHGGPDKAVHHYAADHYAAWRSELGDPAQDFGPGQFGENIATLGITEADLCIGDVFRLGSAIVEVSQGRQPCWKLNAHTGIITMAALFQETARTGWYYRVLEPGLVGVGDTIERIRCPNPGWTVERVTRARLGASIDRKTAAQLAELPQLASGWADAFRRKANREDREDTSARLAGPA